MAYLPTANTITAILTRRGRQIYADNSVNFKISQYAFSDDEVDYSLQQSAIDDPNTDITNLPILEACSNGDKAPIRFNLENWLPGTLQVSWIDVETGSGDVFRDGQQSLRPYRNSVDVFLDVETWSNV
jgi:hypothetical protein